jgi:predicted nucleotidyltransferase
MLEIVGRALGNLVEQVAFVGGAVTPLYVDGTAMAPVRHTDDIDCVIEIASRSEFGKLEAQLRKLGFTHDTDSRLICRWKVKGVTVDVMPTDQEILGFSNIWYLSGIKEKRKHVLPSGTTIHVFPLSYFLASKVEALRSRGGKDWRMAHDLEDIITVLNGNSDPLTELRLAPLDVQQYLATFASKLAESPDYSDLLLSHLGYEDPLCVKRLREIIRAMANL